MKLNEYRQNDITFRVQQKFKMMIESNISETILIEIFVVFIDFYFR